MFEIDSKEIPRGWLYPLSIFQKTSNIYKASYWIKRKEKVFEIDSIQKGFLEVDRILYLPKDVIQWWIKQVIELKWKKRCSRSIRFERDSSRLIVFSLYLPKNVIQRWIKQVIKLKGKVFDSKVIPRGWSYPLSIFQKTSNIYITSYWIKRKEKVFEIDSKGIPRGWSYPLSIFQKT